MRPVLRPGLRLLHDSAGRAVLVDHDHTYRLDATTAGLLTRLDGLADAAAVLGPAPTAATRTAWARLRDRGVVVDVEAPARMVRELPGSARGDALPEATALAAEDPTAAEARWRSRRRATVTLEGGGVVTADLAGLLRRACVGAVVTDRPEAEADVTVLTHDHEPPAETVERLMRTGRPHLVAGTRGAAGIVGPLVRPGATPCLRCVDLTRCRHDPGWGPVRDRVARSPGAAQPGVRPAGAVVCGAVAALAAADVLSQVEGGDPATLGATLTLAQQRPLPVRRSWPTQPACGCAWHVWDTARGQWTA